MTTSHQNAVEKIIAVAKDGVGSVRTIATGSFNFESHHAKGIDLISQDALIAPTFELESFDYSPELFHDVNVSPQLYEFNVTIGLYYHFGSPMMKENKNIIQIRMLDDLASVRGALCYGENLGPADTTGIVGGRLEFLRSSGFTWNFREGVVSQKLTFTGLISID